MERNKEKTISPPGETLRDIRHLSRHLIELSDLQWELFMIDLRTSLAKPLWPASLLLCCGAALGLGGFLATLMALAHAFREWGGFSWMAAFGVTALLGLAIAAALSYAGWMLLLKRIETFGRSGEELRRNLEWLKRAAKKFSSEE